MSGIDIINAALVHLGEGVLTSADQAGTSVSRVVSDRYPHIRDAVLRSYKFNFSEHFATLGGAALAAPSFGYTHECALPSGPSDDAALPWCLRVREVEVSGKWQVAGRAILVACDPPISIRYTRRVEDIGLWDALAFELCALELALACVGSLGSSELRQRVSARASMQLRALRAEARRVDAQEGSPRRIARGAVGSWARPRQALPS